ncbi:hypothetical protein FB45DRAFT_878751 [Roridomyces roridus]|uniref:F-box domain-containing protein n=1 Tax=Roridomyces roridus TaxID=1738132 RepID=A0AAD7F737_9AGAR|nr:hypothetical protein FB45DRAFT_878751 [Roridomyces roridus]
MPSPWELNVTVTLTINGVRRQSLADRHPWRLYHRMRAYRAAFAPHTKLPPEILRQIIIACVASQSVDGSLRANLNRVMDSRSDIRFTLRKVCSKWRSIVLETHELWSLERRADSRVPKDEPQLDTFPVSSSALHCVSGVFSSSSCDPNQLLSNDAERRRDPVGIAHRLPSVAHLRTQSSGYLSSGSTNSEPGTSPSPRFLQGITLPLLEELALECERFSPATILPNPFPLLRRFSMAMAPIDRSSPANPVSLPWLTAANNAEEVILPRFYLGITAASRISAGSLLPNLRLLVVHAQDFRTVVPMLQMRLTSQEHSTITELGLNGQVLKVTQVEQQAVEDLIKAGVFVCDRYVQGG